MEFKNYSIAHFKLTNILHMFATLYNAVVYKCNTRTPVF
jgi:hypothetical protein